MTWYSIILLTLCLCTHNIVLEAEKTLPLDQDLGSAISQGHCGKKKTNQTINNITKPFDFSRFHEDDNFQQHFKTKLSNLISLSVSREADSASLNSFLAPSAT